MNNLILNVTMALIVVTLSVNERIIIETNYPWLNTNIYILELGLGIMLIILPVIPQPKLLKEITQVLLTTISLLLVLPSMLLSLGQIPSNKLELWNLTMRYLINIQEKKDYLETLIMRRCPEHLGNQTIFSNIEDINTYKDLDKHFIKWVEIQNEIAKKAVQKNDFTNFLFEYKTYLLFGAVAIVILGLAVAHYYSITETGLANEAIAIQVPETTTIDFSGNSEIATENVITHTLRQTTNALKKLKKSTESLTDICKDHTTSICDLTSDSVGHDNRIEELELSVMSLTEISNHLNDTVFFIRKLLITHNFPQADSLPELVLIDEIPGTMMLIFIVSTSCFKIFNRDIHKTNIKTFNNYNNPTNDHPQTNIVIEKNIKLTLNLRELSPFSYLRKYSTINQKFLLTCTFPIPTVLKHKHILPKKLKNSLKALPIYFQALNLPTPAALFIKKKDNQYTLFLSIIYKNRDRDLLNILYLMREMLQIALNMFIESQLANSVSFSAHSFLNIVKTKKKYLSDLGLLPPIGREQAINAFLSHNTSTYQDPFVLGVTNLTLQEQKNENEKMEKIKNNNHYLFITYT